MRVNVRFRVNRQTGQVELFEVAEAAGARADSAGHDWEHEQIAQALGEVLEPAPDVVEIERERTGASGGGTAAAGFAADEEETPDSGPEQGELPQA